MMTPAENERDAASTEPCAHCTTQIYYSAILGAWLHRASLLANCPAQRAAPVLCTTCGKNRGAHYTDMDLGRIFCDPAPPKRTRVWSTVPAATAPVPASTTAATAGAPTTTAESSGRVWVGDGTAKRLETPRERAEKAAAQAELAARIYTGIERVQDDADKMGTAQKRALLAERVARQQLRMNIERVLSDDRALDAPASV